MRNSLVRAPASTDVQGKSAAFQAEFQATHGGYSAQDIVDTKTPIVGLIGGSLTVDSSGAANYTVPLLTPTGFEGAVPSLALAYNSNAGDGYVGVGWGVTQPATIHTCDPWVSQVFDDSNGLISDTKTPGEAKMGRCLGGKPLVEISEDPTQDLKFGPNRYYRTVPDTGVLVYGSNFDNGDYEVHGADGSIAKYENFGRDDRWVMTATATTSGHIVEYVYPGDSEDPACRQVFSQSVWGPEANKASTALCKIRYMNGQREIKFNYADHPQPRLIATSEGPKAIDRLLESLEMQVDGVTKWSYQLAYSDGAQSGRKRLAKLSLCAADGQCVPATKFEYSDVLEDAVKPEPEAATLEWDSGFPMPTISTACRIIHGQVARATGVQAIDLNGDGFDDLMWTHRDPNLRTCDVKSGPDPRFYRRYRLRHVNAAGEADGFEPAREIEGEWSPDLDGELRHT